MGFSFSPSTKSRNVSTERQTVRRKPKNRVGSATAAVTCQCQVSAPDRREGGGEVKGGRSESCRVLAGREKGRRAVGPAGVTRVLETCSWCHVSDKPYVSSALGHVSTFNQCVTRVLLGFRRSPRKLSRSDPEHCENRFQSDSENCEKCSRTHPNSTSFLLLGVRVRQCKPQYLLQSIGTVFSIYFGYGLQDSDQKGREGEKRGNKKYKRTDRNTQRNKKTERENVIWEKRK